MQTVFNLDLNKKNSPTSFAYQVPSNTQEMYFRIIENDYVLDYSKFSVLNLRFEFEDGTIYTDTTSSFTVYQNERVVEYKIPSTYLKSIGNATVTPTVKVSNKTVILSPFKIYLYDTESNTCAETNMRNVLTSINYFNYMLSLYYDSIKRDQINKPNGVIGLDSNGDIPLQYFPTTFTNHITDKLIDTKTKSFPNDSGIDIGIHGMKLDSKWRLIYYDEMDKAWRVANSIYGGDFGIPNKPAQWNVWGGKWENNNFIMALSFNDVVDDFIDGGKFNDSTDSTIDANFIDGGNYSEEDRIYGGSF